MQSPHQLNIFPKPKVRFSTRFRIGRCIITIIVGTLCCYGSIIYFWSRAADHHFSGADGYFLLGSFCLLVGISTLWLNEATTIARHTLLKHAKRTIIDIPSNFLNNSNDGKLVFLSAIAETENSAIDPYFDIPIPTLKISRHVEMFQWVEHSRSVHTTSNTDTTSIDDINYYTKEWQESHQNSTYFKQTRGHENPHRMLIRSEISSAKEITVGSFSLDDYYIKKLNIYSSYHINEEDLTRVNKKRTIPYTLFENKLYTNNPEQPEIGDYRIWFSIIPPCQVSIIGEQQEQSIVPHTTSLGTLALLHEYKTNAPAMLKDALKKTAHLTWVLRLAGFILLWFSFDTLFKPRPLFFPLTDWMQTIHRYDDYALSFTFAALLTVSALILSRMFYLIIPPRIASMQNPHNSHHSPKNPHIPEDILSNQNYRSGYNDETPSPPSTRKFLQ